MGRELVHRVLGLAFLCVSLTGCSTVAPFASALTGAMTGSSAIVHSQTEVRLGDANFVTVRTNLVGSSRGFKLLGFITLYPSTLNKAMDRLYARAEATEGRPQTLAHLMIEQSAIYVVLFSIPKTTVRADLVEFVPPPSDSGDSVPPLDARPASQTDSRRRLGRSP